MCTGNLAVFKRGRICSIGFNNSLSLAIIIDEVI